MCLSSEETIQEIKYMTYIMRQIQQVCGASFEEKHLCSTDLEEYLHRIYFYSDCHKNCFIMALILIDRVMEEHFKTKSLPFSIHTLCLASIVVCIKLTEDDTAQNSYYARLGGVTNMEMQNLEIEFLKLSNFKVLVTNDEIESYKIGLTSFTGVKNDTI